MIHKLQITSDAVMARFEFRVFQTLKGLRIAKAQRVRIHDLGQVEVPKVGGETYATCETMICNIEGCSDGIFSRIYLCKGCGMERLFENAAHEIRHAVDFHVEYGAKFGRLRRGKEVKNEAAAILTGGLMRNFYRWSVTCEYDFDRFIKIPDTSVMWHKALWKKAK